MMIESYIGSFQFLGIPPKGEQLFFGEHSYLPLRFQFLGIPPKGEHPDQEGEGGRKLVCSFQFLGIPPKGEPTMNVFKFGSTDGKVSNF